MEGRDGLTSFSRNRVATGKRIAIPRKMKIGRYPSGMVPEYHLSQTFSERRLANVRPSHEVLVDMRPAEVPETFDRLFKQHYARIARLICRVIGDAGRSEELAAEVFWKFHRRPPERENIEGWLCRTAVRSALDSLRQSARRRHYESLSPPPGLPPDPEETLRRKQECERVRSVLAALKPEKAELLLLRSHGLSYAELASALGLNPASVGTFVARAEITFRKEYVKRYGEQ
jgi:RNA polymerase sigma-70 factor, ECF subfamily